MDSLDRRTPLTRTSGVDSVVTTSSPNALDVRSPVSAGCQGLTLLAAFLAWGCEPPLEVGSWKCAAAPLYIPPDGSPELPGRDTVVDPAWESSFEDGFCGYIEARGFCYSDPDAGYELVESPARSGRKAAAFSIITDGNLEGRQTRCVREGQLPKDAFYTAYFYVPQGTKSMGNWNLMHFRTHTETDGLDGKWDVSLANNDDDELVPLLRGYVGDVPIMPSFDHPIPLDRWFSLSVRLRRESTETGVAALYLDGELLVERTDIITDDDSTWGQWYVGNLADNLDPPASTIYVDDVSIRENLPSP